MHRVCVCVQCVFPSLYRCIVDIIPTCVVNMHRVCVCVCVGGCAGAGVELWHTHAAVCFSNAMCAVNMCLRV